MRRCSAAGVNERNVGKKEEGGFPFIPLLSVSFASASLRTASGVTSKMPGSLASFPSLPRGMTMPALLSSLPRGVNPPSLPRGITMLNLPSLPRGVTIPSLSRGVTLSRVIAMPTVPQAPRRLLQDCCSVFDHQTASGNGENLGVPTKQNHVGVLSATFGTTQRQQ